MPEPTGLAMDLPNRSSRLLSGHPFWSSGSLWEICPCMRGAAARRGNIVRWDDEMIETLEAGEYESIFGG